MPIPLPEPITTPATEEKTFSGVWILDLNVRSHTHDSGTVYLNTAPFNPETGEILKTAQKEELLDLWAMAEAVPEAAAALDAVFAAVPAIHAYAEQLRAESAEASD